MPPVTTAEPESAAAMEEWIDIEREEGVRCDSCLVLAYRKVETTRKVISL